MADMGKKQQGLTLIELMVTLAVAIILITVGMPLFNGMVVNNRLTTEANALLSAIQLARSEAVKRGSYVLVAPVSTGWESGWLLYEESNTPGETGYGSQGAGEDTLRVWPEVAASIADGGASFFGFDPAGEADGAVALELTNDGASGSKRRCVIVTLVGQSRVTREEAGATWSCP